MKGGERGERRGEKRTKRREEQRRERREERKKRTERRKGRILDENSRKVKHCLRQMIILMSLAKWNSSSELRVMFWKSMSRLSACKILNISFGHLYIAQT